MSTENMETLDQIVEDATVVDEEEKTNTEESDTPAKKKVMTAEEIEELKNTIDETPFIELMKTKNTVKAEIETYEGIKKMIDGIKEMRGNTELNEKIMLENILSDADFNKTAEEFESEYDSTIEKLNEIINMIDEKITTFGSEEDISKTSFLTGQMVLSLDQRMSKLNKDGLNYDLIMRRMTVVKEAFENRLDHTYLINKAERFLAHKATAKAYRKLGKNDSALAAIMKSLGKKFRIETVAKVLTTIEEMIGSDGAMLFAYFVNRICETEQRSSKDAYIKVLILNIADINAGVFDLCDAEEYKSKLKKDLLDLFANFH